MDPPPSKSDAGARKRKGPARSSAASASGVSSPVSGAEGDGQGKDKKSDYVIRKPQRSASVWLALFVVIVNSSWAVYHYQFERMPLPLHAEDAGKRGFAEVEAMKHVEALTAFGPHPVGSHELDQAIKYVWAVAEDIKKTAHWEVDVQVDIFHSEPGANTLGSGLFVGKTLAYSDLNHVVLRIVPKHDPKAEDNAILISSHIDTVFTTSGAGDCSSCIAVMLELARGVSHWAHGFKNAVIFLFNTGEEEGLNGAHSFITQHPWSSTVRMAVDLEAMGIGGKSSIFQAGPHPLAIEKFALAAKYPSGQIIAQDLFSAGLIKSATDFQIYREVAGLSGLDFAYVDNSVVYHTKNDKIKFLKPGSLQHLGENMLSFLLQIAPSSQLRILEADEKAGIDPAIYFDLLGSYMIVYRQTFANMLYNSFILQSVLIWTTSLLMGGYSAVISLVLSCLSIILMWICSLGFSALVAFILPLISSYPLPYIASPWLVVGLFGAPAFLGALTGQHFGYFILQKHISRSLSKRKENPSLFPKADLARLEAERWLFKGGFIQWLILLILGNYFKVGASYLALVWLAGPAFAYGLLEATLSPSRLPRPLKMATLILSLTAPILVSAGQIIRLTGTIIGIGVRFSRNPGSNPEWLGNLFVAGSIAVFICLTFVYLLSYLHLSGSKRSIVVTACMIFTLSIIIVISGMVAPFTEDTARAVNVVHVVDATGVHGEKQEVSSYVSMFSVTPGKLSKEVEHLKGFTCGRENTTDFVTFSVKYSCLTQEDTKSGWSESDVPSLTVTSDKKVSIDTKGSTRWTLGINTAEIQDFKLSGGTEEIISFGKKSSVDGWHTIQFSGGKNAPTKFEMTLEWEKISATKEQVASAKVKQPLLKLRTDFNRVTPVVKEVLDKLPPWCAQFGKSTSPFNLAFLADLSVELNQ
uniref:Vacuolar membrane protease n=2 Tax=Kalanchoe fedtschenkoi TaxID=63787 RepID=A0A7N0T636_KALFE